MPRRLTEGPKLRRAWRGRRMASPDAGEALGDALLALLKSMGGTPERAGLQRLWDNWAEALGEELGALAVPLCHHAEKPGPGEGAPNAARAGAVLLVGAEDAMLLQELRFRGEEILARVNGFLGHAYFSRVQVSLPLGRSAPVVSRTAAPRAHAAPPGEPSPLASGRFLDAMDRSSPVARCYARFVRRGPGPAADAGAGAPDVEKNED